MGEGLGEDCHLLSHQPWNPWKPRLLPVLAQRSLNPQARPKAGQPPSLILGWHPSAFVVQTTDYCGPRRAPAEELGTPECETKLCGQPVSWVTSGKLFNLLSFSVLIYEMGAGIIVLIFLIDVVRLDRTTHLRHLAECLVCLLVLGALWLLFWRWWEVGVYSGPFLSHLHCLFPPLGLAPPSGEQQPATSSLWNPLSGGPALAVSVSLWT